MKRNIIILVGALILGLGISICSFMVSRGMLKQEVTLDAPITIDNTRVRLVERVYAPITNGEVLVYRPVIEGGDTLRTVMTEKGHVLYVPKSWTGAEIDGTITTIIGHQNWYGSGL
jgi:hypothetical protein